MIGGPIDFDWINKELNNSDINESHRWNYLRERMIGKAKEREEARKIDKGV